MAAATALTPAALALLLLLLLAAGQLQLCCTL
jgi:hypothetical protein